MTERASSAPASATPDPPRVEPWFVALLGVMVALAAFTTDTYLPSLPQVGRDLHASSAATQLTISGVLVGGALGQLVVGPLSDRYGRRRPAMLGIALHVVVSLLCIVAPGIVPLIALRFLQGVGNSAASVVASAVIRDRFAGSLAAQVMSRLMLVIGLAPLLAPTVGGAIAGVAGWRAVFGFLALLGVVVALVVHRWLPETLPPERRRPAGLQIALRGYGALLRDRGFLAFAVLPGLGFGMLMCYVSGSPYVFQQGFGLSSTEFSLLFATNGIALVVGAQVNGSLVRRFSPLGILRVAIPAEIVLAAVLLVLAATGWGGLIGMLVPLWFLLALNGLVPPNAAALALSRHGEIAGTAAALIGALQSGLAGLVSPLVGVLGDDAVAMTSVMLGVLVVAFVVAGLGTPTFRRRRA